MLNATTTKSILQKKNTYEGKITEKIHFHISPSIQTYDCHWEHKELWWFS